MASLKIIPKQKVEDGLEYNTLFTYDYIEGIWISSISVFDNKLINNSNHFIDLFNNDTTHSQETGNYNIKRKPTYIYSRIASNYNKIIKNNNNNENIITIEDKCILLHNSFSSGNAGHDLCCILNTFMKYKDYKDLKFILFDEINNNNNIQIIKLFINDSQIIKINEKQIYNFKKQIFNHEKSIHNPSLDYINIINEIKDKIINKCENEISKDELEKLKHKKIIIIKSTIMKLIVRNEDCFTADILFNYLKENDWYICNDQNVNKIDKFEAIILETSVRRYNQSSPLFIKIINFMYKKNFIFYDLCDLKRLDGTNSTLIQFDALFINKNSKLINKNYY